MAAPPSPARGGRAAFFDLDGTLLPDTSCDRELVRALRRSRRLPPRALLRGLGYSLGSARHGAAAMWGVRGYLAGWTSPEFARFCAEVVEQALLPRIAPEGLRRMTEHRARGDLVVLLTGAPEQVAEPLGLRLAADVVVAGRLELRLDSLTGWLLEPTPRGHEKARHIRRLAQQYQLDLAESWAYANTWDDASHMALTGHPIAVNPGPLLRRMVRRYGWPVEHWAAPPRRREEAER